MIELLDKVIAHNSSVEVIKLFLEQEQKKEFTKALIKFRQQCPEIEKLEEGENLRGELYNYAKLEMVQRKVKTPLCDNGLFYRFNQKTRGETVTVQCVISHVSGHYESSIMSAQCGRDMALTSEQQTAVTTSYLKRYTLWNALGLTLVDADTDGASKPKTKGGAQGLREAIERTEKSAHTQRVKAGGESTAEGHSHTPKAPEGMKFSHYERAAKNNSQHPYYEAVAVFVPEREPAKKELEIENGDPEIEALVSEIEESLNKELTEETSDYELAVSVTSIEMSMGLRESLEELCEQAVIQDIREAAGFIKIIFSAKLDRDSASKLVYKTIGKVTEDWELEQV